MNRRIWLLSCVLFCSFFNSLKADNYYWVGGSGNWSDINHWSAVSGNNPMQLHTVTPTSNDNVILDALSFPSTGGTIEINLNLAFCKNLIINNVPSNVTINFHGSNKRLRIFGDIMITDTINWNGDGKILLEGTNTNYIKITDAVLPNLYANSLGKTWVVQDSLEVGKLVTEYGVFDLNENHLNANNIECYNSSTLNIQNSTTHCNNFYVRHDASLEMTNAEIEINSVFEASGSSTINSNGASIIMKQNSGFFHDYTSAFHKYGLIDVLSNYCEIKGNAFCTSEKIHIENDALLSGSLKSDTIILDSTSTITVSGTLTLDYFEGNGNCNSRVEIVSLNVGDTAYINHSSTNDTLSFIRARNIKVVGEPLTVKDLENVNNTSVGFNDFDPNTTLGQKFYWIAGSGRWDDSNNWSLTNEGSPADCIPGELDSVIIDNIGSSAAPVNIALPDKEINVSSIYVHTSHNVTFTGGLKIILDGTLDLDSNVNLNNHIFFTGSDLTYYVRASGNALGNLSFLGSGKWELTDDISGNRIVHLNGTLDARSILVNSQIFRSDSVENPVTLMIDNSIIKTTQFLAPNLRNASTDGSKIWLKNFNCNSGGSECWSLQTGVHVQWDTLFVEDDLAQLNGNNKFRFVEFVNSAAVKGALFTDSVIFEKGKEYKINTIHLNSINAIGDCGNYIDFTSTGSSSNWHLNGGNKTVSFAIFKNTVINNGSISALNSFDNSGNTGISFTLGTPRTLYWVGGSGNWEDASHWSITSGGAGGECLPTPIDSIVIDVNSNNSGSSSWDISLSSSGYMKHLNVTSNSTFSGFLSPIWQLNRLDNKYLKIYGSIYLNKNISVNVGTNLYSNEPNEVIKSSYSYFRSISINAFSTTYSVLDSLRAYRFTQNSGNINLNGNYLNVHEYVGNGGVFSTSNSEMTFTYTNIYGGCSWNIPLSDIRINNTMNCNGTVNANNSTIELYGSAPNLRMTSADTLESVLFSNSNGTGNFSSTHPNALVTHLEFQGDGVFSSGSRCDTVVFTNGHSYYLKEGQTLFIDKHFNSRGDPCNPILIRSTSQGNQSNIQLGDTLSGDYLEIRDISSSGAPFYAGLKSADQGNNNNLIWANKPGYVWGFGNDRYVLRCDTSSINGIYLPTDGFEDALGFTWMDGSTNTTYFADVEDTYWVTANYGLCDVTDSVNVFFDTVLLGTGGDMYICLFDTLTISPIRDSFESRVSLLWNDNTTDVSKTFVINADTTIWVEVTDSYGNICADTLLILTSDVQNNFVLKEPCKDESNGYIYVSSSGGLPDYTYLWSDGSTSDSLLNINTGYYWVTATDSIGCIKTDSIFLDEPDSLLISNVIKSDFNGYNISCYGGSNGVISASVSGGTFPYHYSWSNTTDSISTIIDVMAGSISLEVSDAQGCTVSEIIVMTEPDSINTVTSVSSNYNGYAISCYGQNDGSIHVDTITGGVSPYAMSWSNGVNTPTISNLSAGTYSLFITDFNGCVDTTQLTLNEPNELLANSSVTGVSCYGGSDGIINLVSTGGVGQIDLIWSNGDTAHIIDNLSSNWYTYNLTSLNNCSTVDSVFVHEPLPISFLLDTIPPTCTNSFDGELNIQAQGGTGGYDYFVNGTSFSGSIQGLGIDTLEIRISDENDCDTVFSIVLLPTQTLPLIPNWFSPNGNGNEDVWYIDWFDCGQFTLKVFNIYGQLIYSAESQNYIPWDGTFNGKQLPSGDYYYVIESEDYSNQYTGYVTILH